MTNLSEKKFQIYKDIEGLDDFLKFLKISDNFYIYNTMNDISKNTRGIYFEHYSRKRFFCECGYVGSSLDSSQQPRCHNCGNVQFAKHFIPNKSQLLKYYEPTFNDDIFKLYSIKYYWEGEEIIKIKKEKKLVASVSKDNFFLKSYDTHWPPNNIGMREYKNIFSVLPDNIQKKLSVILFNDEESYKYETLDFYLISLILKGILNNSFNDSWEDDSLGLNLIILAISDRFPLLERQGYYKDFSAVDQEDLYNFIISLKNTRYIKKILKIDNLKNEIIKKILSYMNINLKTFKKFNEIYETLSETERKALDIILLYGNSLYFVENILDSQDKIYKGREAEILVFFYEKEKHIFNNEILEEYLKRRDFLKVNYPNIEITEDIIRGKSFELLNNKKALVEQYRIPENKVEAFIYLLEKEPLKAYEIFKNRRKLNEKDLKKIYK